MVTIEVPAPGGPQTLTVDRGTWSSANALLQRMAETLAQGWEVVVNKRVYDPDPDYHVAEYVAGQLGGKIVKADKVPYEAGAIY